MNIENLTFEQAYQQLEAAVQMLDNEKLPLAEMITLYQQGIALAKYCDQQLDQAELSIKMLSETGELIELS
jgi:exodeoxyribonuclease VII small subunit